MMLLDNNNNTHSHIHTYKTHTHTHVAQGQETRSFVLRPFISACGCPSNYAEI